MFRNWAFVGLLLAAATAQGDQNVVVVLDDSGSMKESMRSDSRLTKMAAAKQALLAVLERLPPDAKLGIVLLNGQRGSNQWAYPLGPVNRANLGEAIQGITAGGGTPLGERMKTGADALLALREKEHYGSYRLLIVTDGEATDGSMVDDYLPDILARGIWVDVIGVDMAGNHSLATRVHTYRRADSPADLEKVITEVLAESTDAAGDVDESAFEIIAAIPDDVAVAALEALSESGNQPIGEIVERRATDQAAERAVEQAAVTPGPRAPVVPGAQEGVPDGQEPEDEGRGFSFWFLLIIAVAVVVYVVRTASRPRRS